ncbi:MAG: zf-HC2 domain-containing protein [Vulcanimicrobiaceae bacterium]
MNEEHLSPEQLLDYLRGELAPEEDARAYAHVAECATCRCEQDEQVRLSELLREYARQTERPMPQGVVASVRSVIEVAATRPPFLLRLRSALRPAFAVPLAVAVLLLALLVQPWRPALAPAPTLNARALLSDHAAMAHVLPFSQGNALPSVLEHRRLSRVQTYTLGPSANRIADASR